MIEFVKDYLKVSSSDAALIVSPENRFYFTNFASSDGFLLVSADRAVFITDGRYIEAAQKAVKNCEVMLQSHTISQIKDVLTALGAKSVAVEAERMTLKQYAEFARALDGIDVVCDGELDVVIEKIRSIKSKAQVEKIIKAQRIAEAAFEHILTFIKEGVTEKEVALELDYYMLSHGAEGLSFETIAVSGKNSSKPHGVPSDKKIEKGDFVTMDFGAVVEGYHSDMTRTVAVGFVTDEQKNVYETVLKAQAAAQTAASSGVCCADVDKAARDVIENAGYGEYFNHSTGHGVGVEIHEYPRLSKLCKTALSVGNVVTDEPGIYIPEKFGVRIEDMLLITENGCENLTRAPKELIIL